MPVSAAISRKVEIVPSPGLCVQMVPMVDATATVTPVMPRTLPNLQMGDKLRKLR